MRDDQVTTATQEDARRRRGMTKTTPLIMPTHFLAQGIAETSPLLRCDRIRASLRNIGNEFINIGLDLRDAYRQNEWERLNLPNFTAYVSQFNLSDSLGYDLIRIGDLAASFPGYRARMADVGVSNLRLLLPHLPEDANEEQIDTVLDMGATKSWNELRKELNPSAPGEPVSAYCPHCGAEVLLSRAAKLSKP